MAHSSFPSNCWAWDSHESIEGCIRFSLSTTPGVGEQSAEDLLSAVTVDVHLREQYERLHAHMLT